MLRCLFWVLARLLFDPTLGVVDDESLTFGNEEMAVAEEPQGLV